MFSNNIYVANTLILNSGPCKKKHDITDDSIAHLRLCLVGELRQESFYMS